MNLLTPVANLKLGGITAALMALLKHSRPETCTLLRLGRSLPGFLCALCSGRLGLERGWISHRSPALLGRLVLCARHCDGVYHRSAEAHMMHSLEEAWALDDDYRGRADDHTVHGLHAAGAILGCGPTELYPLLRICCESYSATETLLCSALLMPGARPESASNLCRPSTRKVGSTLQFGPQL